eukprot:scaffold51312_cov31-Attheya_sp.AAC.2
MEACVSPYSPPVSVTLPPRLPPNRLGYSTQAEGVVEQYERFIFVMEFFSPIYQWGQAKRPSGIQSDTVSNQCAQYFAIRSLNKSRIGVILHKVEGCSLGLEKKATQQ